jgi:hypothetical protein
MTENDIPNARALDEPIYLGSLVIWTPSAALETCPVINSSPIPLADENSGRGARKKARKN